MLLATPPSTAPLQNIAVEKEERAEGNLLGGGGHLALDSQVGAISTNFGNAHGGWRALVMKEDESLDRLGVGKFGFVTEMS